MPTLYREVKYPKLNTVLFGYPNTIEIMETTIGGQNIAIVLKDTTTGIYINAEPTVLMSEEESLVDVDNGLTYILREPLTDSKYEIELRYYNHIVLGIKFNNDGTMLMNDTVLTHPYQYNDINAVLIEASRKIIALDKSNTFTVIHPELMTAITGYDDTCDNIQFILGNDTVSFSVVEDFSAIKFNDNFIYRCPVDDKTIQYKHDNHTVDIYGHDHLLKLQIDNIPYITVKLNTDRSMVINDILLKQPYSKDAVNEIFNAAVQQYRNNQQ